MAAAAWVGRPIDGRQIRLFKTLLGWLEAEAAELGGIGPNERSSLGVRHIADSLCFARGWASVPLPNRIVDLGAGAGLPTLPLAILHPESLVIAVDRSGRRCRLIRRAARILDLTNVDVIEQDFADLDLTAPAVVSRAAMPPEALRGYLARLTEPGGVAVVGGSHVRRPEADGYETVAIPSEILDREAWLLMMATP